MGDWSRIKITVTNPRSNIKDVVSDVIKDYDETWIEDNLYTKHRGVNLCIRSSLEFTEVSEIVHKLDKLLKRNKESFYFEIDTYHYGAG